MTHLRLARGAELGNASDLPPIEFKRFTQSVLCCFVREVDAGHEDSQIRLFLLTAVASTH